MTYTTIPVIQKSPLLMWERSSFVYNGDLYRAGFRRSLTAFVGVSIIIEKYLPIYDAWTKLAEIPFAACLGCIYCDGTHIYAFATTEPVNGSNQIMRWEIDPATWQLVGSAVSVRISSGGYQFFNSSVCSGPNGFILAYETNEATPFSIRFLQSKDLLNWSPVGDLCNRNSYSGCPCIYYAENGWYVVTYLMNDAGKYITVMSRTQDFINLEVFSGNSAFTACQQLLAPDGVGEGINTSDIDFCEFGGQVHFTYLVGDQATWGVGNDAIYQGSLLDLYHEFWPI